MYGWIVDGITSLFEPVEGQKPTGWPANVTREIHTPAAATAKVQRQESHARPAKRNYQSVHAADNVAQIDQVEIKRQKRDVVLSFVKKTVAGVARLFRLHRPPSPTGKKHSHYADIQIGPVALMGIDELNTSWTSSSDWMMDKQPASGLCEREKGGVNMFPSSTPPLLKKQASSAVAERGKERENPRRRSVQLLPSWSSLGAGTGPSNPDPVGLGSGAHRGHRTCLAVEQALKESDREHYRRLVEMVSEKYSKSQPLPFNRTKPQGGPLSQDAHRPALLGRTSESAAMKPGPLRAPSSVIMWRDVSSAKQTKDRRGEMWINKTLIGSVDTQATGGATQSEVDLSAEVAARLSLQDRETPALAQTDAHATHPTHTRHSDEDLPRLTKEMAVEVSRALAQRDPNLVLSSAFKLRITQRDLATLQETSWLNDEVINFYLSLVAARSSAQGSGGLRVYAFSTFFFPKLRGGGAGGGGQPGGHSAVRRWTKAVDLFQYEVLLVPLHLGVHWSLAVVDFKSRSVRSYDSMGQRHDDICSMLLLYLKEEHKAKKEREMDISKWFIGSMRASEIPQQKNGSDCGVFACKYADYISQGRPLTFRQCHMPLFRKLMIWEILNQRLL
ncbi:sentrin-specific protease 2 isoform X1 [Osmerus eperlanus]|uniref:sentrin-specific protease 2 isoform X1 n=2 Tax=Osmerus eperlanus TaxID=29151 RepID=UPI002E0DC3BF